MTSRDPSDEAARRIHGLLPEPGWLPFPPAVAQLRVHESGPDRHQDAGPDLGDALPVVRPDDLALRGSVLARWRAGRVDPGRRGAAALALVAALAVLLTAAVVIRSRPQPVPAPAPPAVLQPGAPAVSGPVMGEGASEPGQGAAGGVPAAAEDGAAAAGGQPLPQGPATPAGSGQRAAGGGQQAAAGGGQVVVAVLGTVALPGLVRLPPGSRVDDAVRAAGGVLPGSDPGLLNLARVLTDGEQVFVGIEPPPGQPAPGPAPAGPAGGAPPASASGPVDLNTATLADLDGLPGVGPVLAQRILDWRTDQGPFTSVDQLREVSGIGEKTFAELEPAVAVR